MNLLIVGLSENCDVRGVERYAIELVRALSRNSNIKITLICGGWQRYFCELASDNVTVEVINISNSKICRHLWHYFLMPFRFKKFDIVHIVNTNPILFRLGKPVVATIHDLAEYFVPEKYGRVQRYYRRFVSWLLSKVATHIITVSHYSKSTIIDKLKVFDAKVSAIYLGVDHFRVGSVDVLPMNDHQISLDIDGDYLLYWGVLERSKGVTEAINGFRLFKNENVNSGLKLVLVGKMGNAEQDISVFLNDKDIFYLGRVSDSELKVLSKGAKAVIFPSKYEGFGFPPLEGFVYCDNVIASSTTSVGEITKLFATHVDPENILDISKSIDLILKNPKKFSLDEKKMIFDDFSWEKCGIETLAVYKKFI